MPVDPDFAREERIKRNRAVIKSGQDHLLLLSEALPAWSRLASVASAHSGSKRIDELLDKVPGYVKQESDYRLGHQIWEKYHRTFTKIYKWLQDTDNASPRNLLDETFEKYSRLERPTYYLLDNGTNVPVADQVARLAEGIEDRLALVLEQLTQDGEHEDIAPALRDASGGWPHLRNTGLLTDAVINGYLARMRTRRTKSEISDAIGAAKEITEATLKALTTRHGVVIASKTPDLADYWKPLKPYLSDAALDKALGSNDGAVMKLLGSQISIIQTLGELRNKVGTGHGVTAHPAGLLPAHALLAVDLAHTVTRFLTA